MVAATWGDMAFAPIAFEADVVHEAPSGAFDNANTTQPNLTNRRHEEIMSAVNGFGAITTPTLRSRLNL